MSARRRFSFWVLLPLGICLAAVGCQLQIGFVDQATKPPPTPQASPRAAPYEGQPAPLQLTSGGAPVQSGPINNGPVYNGGVVNGMPSNGAMPAAPVGPAADGQPGSPSGPPLAPERGGIPGELRLRSHPPYVVEPPDILLIDTIRMIPKAPYVISPLDLLQIRLAGPRVDQRPDQAGDGGAAAAAAARSGHPPIDGQFLVGPDGSVNLGEFYGVVRLSGLTLTEAEQVIRIQVKRAGVNRPELFVGLAQLRGVQQARGEHLVRQDGTISLGTYGCVYVAGLTLAQVKVAIERHLSQYVQDPEVTVDVFAYNSKYYYVITDGAGYGQQVYRFPVVGKETVLDAINNIGGIPIVGSPRKIWVARPAPPEAECTQILPVDWLAITQGGATATNYQLFPGDRVYVSSDPFIKADNVLGKVLAPIERMMGALLLGTTVANSFRNNGNNGGNSGVGFIAPLR